jgi:hypothetical protein
MAQPNQMLGRTSFRQIAAATLVIGLIASAAAVELDPKATAIRRADEIKWRDPIGAAPVNDLARGEETIHIGTCAQKTIRVRQMPKTCLQLGSITPIRLT